MCSTPIRSRWDKSKIRIYVRGIYAVGNRPFSSKLQAVKNRFLLPFNCPRAEFLAYSNSHAHDSVEKENDLPTFLFVCVCLEDNKIGLHSEKYRPLLYPYVYFSRAFRFSAIYPHHLSHLHPSFSESKPAGLTAFFSSISFELK